MNRITLSGNLGRDPITATSRNGRTLAVLSMACHEILPNGTRAHKPDWIEVRLFGSEADVAAACLKRGSPVEVEGDLRRHGERDYVLGSRVRMGQPRASRNEAVVQGALQHAPRLSATVKGTPVATFQLEVHARPPLLVRLFGTEAVEAAARLQKGTLAHFRGALKPYQGTPIVVARHFRVLNNPAGMGIIRPATADERLPVSGNPASHRMRARALRIRGHQRWQRYGPGGSQRKQIWIPERIWMTSEQRYLIVSS